MAYCDLDKTEEGRGCPRLFLGYITNQLKNSLRFIEFFTQEDAQHAVKILNGKRLGGRKIRVVDHEVRTTKHISPLFAGPILAQPQGLREVQDRRHSWDRRPQSPEWRLSPGDYSLPVDRSLDISARRVYSPVPRVPKIASAYDYSKHRHPETESCAYHITSSIAYEEPYNWSYNVAKIVSQDRASYDYSQHRFYDDIDGAYDDGELGYDSRSQYQFQSRVFDPYQ